VSETIKLYLNDGDLLPDGREYVLYSAHIAVIAALRGMLIDAEALLCDERVGPTGNELASRIRAFLSGDE
jgi:hypothetical protein